MPAREEALMYGRNTLKVLCDAVDDLLKAAEKERHPSIRYVQELQFARTYMYTARDCLRRADNAYEG